MTGLVLFVAFPVLQTLRQAQPTPPARTHDTLIAPSPSASSTPSPAVAAAAPPVKEEWPQDEIAAAREQCAHVLASTAADIEWLDPIKKGDCGLPAPVRLKGIGSDSNKVVFDPPVDVNCRMVAALGKWVKGTLQPKARDRLKTSVTRIVGASGYSCRNIYNRPDARLSQHALANAIDIGGFVLANGRTIGVLKGWGPTERDIKAQAKAKAEAAAKAKAGGSKRVVAETQDVDATDSDPARSGKPDRQVKQASMTPTALSLRKKPTATDVSAAIATEPPKPTKEALFLRAIHGGACHEFGTVLGPEANDPHRNHFHLDLISRRGSGYCD